MSEVTWIIICSQGRMQWFSGGGAKKIIGANNAFDIRVVGHPRLREICPTWGAFSAKSAPPGALSPRNLPHLGHFLRKMCPTWGTFTAKPAPPKALSPQNLPHLGHCLRKICPTWGTFTAKSAPPRAFQRKICPTWDTFSVKSAPPGALYAIRRGILGQGAGQSPHCPAPVSASGSWGLLAAILAWGLKHCGQYRCDVRESHGPLFYQQKGWFWQMV